MRIEQTSKRVRFINHITSAVNVTGQRDKVVCGVLDIDFQPDFSVVNVILLRVEAEAGSGADNTQTVS